MTLVDRILSLVTLLSLFIVTPTLGKAIVIWWGKERLKFTLSQQLAIALSTMMTIVPSNIRLWRTLEDSPEIGGLVRLDKPRPSDRWRRGN
jgi:hypothetical protein